ncbi:hypothetical protein [Carnobacterium jeotgali]|uniref:hypothetical protein n=1 Tax=Carnobacterium jeotgali TaxID=545534 RepID=UPI00388EC9E2
MHPSILSSLWHIYLSYSKDTIPFTVKKPSETEVKHDSLWRIHGILDKDPLPDHLIDKNIWKARFRQLNDFERYLTENGFPVIKFFFNVSKDVQMKHLLERMKHSNISRVFGLILATIFCTSDWMKIFTLKKKPSCI